MLRRRRWAKCNLTALSWHIQRALQNILRFYVYFRTRSVTSAAGRPTGKTTRLLLLVFLLSSIRKLRNLSELISPLVPTGLSKQRIHRFAGTQDLAPEGLGWSRAVGSSIDEGKGDDKAAPARHVSTTKWYWTEKHAWADVSASASSSSSRVCPPASDHASLLLRHRLDGLETTLSLLDTVADGVALFARFGITVTIPFALLRRMIAPSAESGSKRNNSFLYRTFRRAETLADVFWLTGTVLSLFETELERREVWQFGKNVRRSMRDEEVLRAHADRLREALTATIGPASIASGEGDTPSASKEEQLLALDEADQACAAHIKSQRRALRDLRGRLTWLWWERVRLGADGVFALYDVFEFSSGSEAVRAVAGTVSAAVGFSQVSRYIFSLCLIGRELI